MSDARVLRDREADFLAAIDRRGARRVPEASARRLVSIYNGGAMPAAPDRVYLSHPVELDGSESEGATGTPSVNTGVTLPVVVLHGVPAVGDLLVATAVGGRWVASVAPASGTDICVTSCYPAIPVYGALVQVYTSAGGSLVASCTTGSSGCCTVPLSGSYYLTVTVSGSVAYSGTRTLSGTVSVAISSSDVVCCGGYAIPINLTLTDAIGSLSFVYYSNYYYPIWYGGHAATGLSSSVTTPNNVCVAASPSDGPVRVCYQMTCIAGSQPTFSIQRSWSWVYEQGTLTSIWYQDPTGFTPGQPCATSPPAACGGPHTDTSSFGANPSSTSPFALSGTPAPAAGNATADPVGGSVAISA